ncbi:DUF3833 domain-containing protein [Ottowia sp.]|jgi:hypothetical protein|uniref:DUF3833 domain-containing protein n=1 Tax=Ottowia sp. TaxID=1898956 RepID=UPI002B5ACCD1|nr:DUF3833 domain-containing protein [Ottowia sp.]HRN77231.1 DUF3833 domain-containing protein [Ottowia sp.]HRQ04209.1 DUF3833 domain-containing protein [Ottowia sp.]
MNTRRHVLFALLAGSAVLVAGCANPQVSDYAQQQPTLELDRYFNGRIRAHGMFQKRGGEVVRRFTVVMDCHWQGNQGVLDEAFTYSDGTTERRVWRLTKHADGRYTGRADDVVGEAQGQTSGNAFRWNYTLRLPVDGTTYEVQFDDWMFLIDERVMLNRATMSKFGVSLGEVLLSFRKE